MHGQTLSLFDRVPARATKTLRPYQREIIGAVGRELRDHRSTLVVSPTGSGKSVTAAEIIRTARRALFLAPQTLLVDQARAELEGYIGRRFEVEQGGRRASIGGDAHVVATVQSIMREDRLRRFPPDTFSHIIVDEADCFGGESFRRPFEHFTGAKLVGFTATPHGMDKRTFETVAYSAGLWDFVVAGWLTPLDCAPAIRCDVDLSKVRTGEGGDFIAEDLDEAMLEVIAPIVTAALEHVGDAQAGVFTPGIKAARLAADTLNRLRPGCARSIDSQMAEDSAEVIAAWKRGEFQFMCNVRMLTRGFDYRGLGVMIDAAPTKSRKLQIQKVGRILRPLADVDAHGSPEARRDAIAGSLKPRARWINLALNSEDLESPLTILAEGYDPKEVRRARKRLESGGGDPMAALAEARRHYAAAAEKARVRLELGSSNPIKRRAKRPERKPVDPQGPPTAGQLRALARFGAPVPATLEEAQSLLRYEFLASSKGWCDYKQRQWLQSHVGVSGKGMRVEDAKPLVEHWRRVRRPFTASDFAQARGYGHEAGEE